MSAYSDVDPELTSGNDIQVIDRGDHEHLDNQFLSHVDSNGALNNLLFDDLPHDDRRLYDDHNQPTGLSPLTEFIASNGDHIVNYDDDKNTGALTRHHALPLPPMVALSEPVIPSHLTLPTTAGLPEYIQNANRPLALLGNPKKKREPVGPKLRPAFVMKIWSMVNDPANHQFIRWGDTGDSFVVLHREEFMKSVLPKYFKHNNFASFVRQLNMYGWHKVQDITSGSLKDDKNLEEVLQFKNPFFQQNREDLLDKIVRNKASGLDSESDASLNLQHIVSELELIKMNQLAILEDMRRMRKDNQTLWNESFNARERHLKQGQALDKIMKFLAAVYGSSAGKIFEVANGSPEPNANNQVAQYKSKIPTGFVPQSPNPYSNPQPVLKPRLMLMDHSHHGSPVTQQSSQQPTPSQHQSTSSQPGWDSQRGSVEQIPRNDADINVPNGLPDPQSANVNKIYQQIMNLGGGAAQSPRQYFPELNSPSMGPIGNNPYGIDALLGLEQNIYKQGQALLQVQDWILALASKQQQQQQQLQQQQQRRSLEFSANADLDDFDVDEFLNSNSSASPNLPPVSAGDGIEDLVEHPKSSARNKRHIEEVLDDGEDASRTTRRRTRK